MDRDVIENNVSCALDRYERRKDRRGFAKVPTPLTMEEVGDVVKALSQKGYKVSARKPTVWEWLTRQSVVTMVCSAGVLEQSGKTMLVFAAA